ncbi:hypothetical protein [Thalassolituus sp.]|jgi:hypothetical protein|uniref:hypothetical protein n=1 Tax=Thalassolituus sp. TaxID=2030822 RepID=UPI002A8078B1|nr:hypothetical protein [Thalassolituus sp.]
MKHSTSILALPLLLSGCVLDLPGDFPEQDEVCEFDQAREDERATSAANFPTPQIQRLLVNGNERWSSGQSTAPQLVPGDEITLVGTGFGAGTELDFSKIMIGNTRILETDLIMYKQELALSAQVNFETTEVVDEWPKNVLGWTDTEIRFRVPDHTLSGDLIVQIQKRTGFNQSLTQDGEAHLVIDAQTSRVIDDNFVHNCDVVSDVSAVKSTTPIGVTVDNAGFDALAQAGSEAFWSWDYNVGLAHNLRNLDWTAIMQGKATDPISGGIADPKLLFGAVPEVRGEVPDEAIDDVYFNEYPMPTPIPGFLAGSEGKKEGNTKSSGYVGYRYAEATNPYAGNGEWIGFKTARLVMATASAMTKHRATMLIRSFLGYRIHNGQ